MIQTLATAVHTEERPPPSREGEYDAATSRMESASEVAAQLSQWPTTWSVNFSDRLLSMSGGGSELNTEEQIIGRRQALIFNAQLSGNLAADAMN